MLKADNIIQGMIITYHELLYNHDCGCYNACGCNNDTITEAIYDAQISLLETILYSSLIDVKKLPRIGEHDFSIEEVMKELSK